MIWFALALASLSLLAMAVVAIVAIRAVHHYDGPKQIVEEFKTDGPIEDQYEDYVGTERPMMPIRPDGEDLDV